MNNKQIEEMAKIICKPTANKGECDKCGFKRSCSKFDDATDLYNAGFRKTNEWIPVTERLPEETQDFLVVLDNGNIDIRLFNSKAEPWITYSLMLNKFVVLNERREWTVEYKVTHWMPLPEPPERSDE